MHPDRPASEISEQTKKPMSDLEYLFGTLAVLRRAESRARDIDKRDRNASMGEVLLPESDRNHLARLVEKLANEDVSRELSSEIAGTVSRSLERMYRDPLLDMPNGEYFKQAFADRLDDRFASYFSGIDPKEREALREAGRRVAQDVKTGNFGFETAFFDVDGLKSINDVFGHTAGDRYLRLARDVLVEDRLVTEWERTPDGAIDPERPKEIRPTVLSELRKQGIEILAAHRSGDEFLLLIPRLPETPVECRGETWRSEGESFATFVTRLVQEDLRSVDAASVVDFSQSSAREAYRTKGIESFPERFRLSATAGVFSPRKMYEGYLRRLQDTEDADESSRTGLDRRKGYRWLVNYYTTRLIEGADHEMNRLKGETKRQRMESSDDDERALQRIYDLGRGEKEKEIETLKEYAGSLEEKLKETEQALTECRQKKMAYLALGKAGKL